MHFFVFLVALLGLVEVEQCKYEVKTNPSLVFLISRLKLPSKEGES